MKRIFFLFLSTLLVFKIAWAEDADIVRYPDPDSTPQMTQDQVIPKQVREDSDSGGKDADELLYSPAEQSEQTEQPSGPLYSPAAGEALYSPVRESELPHGTFNAELTMTWQTADLDKNSSMARRYRTLTDGLLIKSLSLNYEMQDQEFRGSFRNIAPLTNITDDGHMDLNYRRYGILDVRLGISKFPHNYTDKSDISTLRDNYGLHVRLTPGDLLTLTTSLTIENMNGERPLTIENLTGSAGTPTAITELREPTDYTTASFAVGLEYTDDHVNMQFNNTVQVFTNARPDEIIWDNPWQTGAFGRAKAADDYTVYTLSFKPSVKFSDRVRLINSLSYSKVAASVKLAPFTTEAGVGEAFQKDVLDPDVRSLNASSTLTTLPFPDLRLNVKYRYYAYENDTPQIEDPPAYVMLDGSSTKYSRRPRYTSTITRSLGIDGNWYVSDRLSVDAGAEDKGNPRREREVEEDNVRSFFITVNAAIYGNLSGQVGYRHERKRGVYDTAYYKATYDPLSDVNQHQLLRAFDLSDSDSHSLKAVVDYSPLDMLKLSALLSATMSNHPDVIIGRRTSRTESAFISAELTPFKDLLLYSSYSRDSSTTESRYSWTYDSNLAASYPQETNPLYSAYIIPVSETIEDTSHSYSIGFDYNLYEKISLNGNYSRYEFTGTTVTMPEVSSTTDTYEFKISYRPGSAVYRKGISLLRLKDLRISAGYYSEIYGRKDHALDNFPDPVDIVVPGDPEDMFLGIREPDYNLSIFSLSLAFYF